MKDIERLKKKTLTLFSKHFKNLKKKKKTDNTWVTLLDEKISEMIKRDPIAKNFSFLSEEDYESEKIKFPCLILDPIDGTAELVKGVPECALSLALMKNKNLKSNLNKALIFNPMSGFSLSSEDDFFLPPHFYKQDLLGLVSRSEWEEKLIDTKDNILHPRGSIAFKLALLASGACDFVYSNRSKKIWDIAAGTILCAQRGYSFYSQGKEIKELKNFSYPAPLVWCRPSLKKNLGKYL